MILKHNRYYSDNDIKEISKETSSRGKLRVCKLDMFKNFFRDNQQWHMITILDDKVDNIIIATYFSDEDVKNYIDVYTVDYKIIHFIKRLIMDNSQFIPKTNHEKLYIGGINDSKLDKAGWSINPYGMKQDSVYYIYKYHLRDSIEDNVFKYETQASTCDYKSFDYYKEDDPTKLIELTDKIITLLKNIDVDLNCFEWNPIVQTSLL